MPKSPAERKAAQRELQFVASDRKTELVLDDKETVDNLSVAEYKFRVGCKLGMEPKNFIKERLRGFLERATFSR